MTRKETEYEIYLIKVDAERCTGCEECIVYCPADVFEIHDGSSVPIRPKNCLGCNTCVAVCKSEAIIVTEI